MGRDWQQQLKDTFQPHVSEPISAVGLVQPAGTMGSFGLGQLSPLAAMFKNSGVNKRAGGLATTSALRSTKLAAIVVTPGKVHAFRTKQRGYNWKVQEELGSWDRADVTFTVTPQKITNHVAIDVASTGEHFELEAQTAGTRGFHDAFFAEIAK